MVKQLLKHIIEDGQGCGGRTIGPKALPQSKTLNRCVMMPHQIGDKGLFLLITQLCYCLIIKKKLKIAEELNSSSWHGYFDL
ncbi:MAG: hypothetical protein H6645_04230 [Caldilineaceae bacterium]|nr:hypothetical protein [Caldilineaceae bacterium]